MNFQWDSYLDQLPNLLLALVVLFVGWLIAKIIEKGVKKGLEKTSIDDKLFSSAKQRNSKYSSEKIISKIVYFIILAFVFVWFFNILSLSFIAQPIVNMLSEITAAVPNLLKAALILLFAWIAATALSWLVRKVGKTANIDRLLQKWNLTKTEEGSVHAIEQASKVVFYLVLLIFLPGVLSALNITGISAPFENMIQGLLLFIPKLFAAALILFIGWLIAKIVRDILTNFLKSIGTEKLAERMGLSKLLEGTSLSSVIGTIVYIFILIPVTISALEQLDIEGISAPAINMLNDVMTMIPNIAIAIVLILVGIWLGKWVGQLVTSLLDRLGVNSLAKNMSIGNWNPSNAKYSISHIIGMIAQIFIVVLFTVEALQVIQLEFLVDLATGVIAYLPAVFAAIVILAIGLYVGNLVETILTNVLSGSGHRALSAIAKYTIIALAFFMALDQLGVAASIVNAAFILILGGLALAFGLSFGLGGKELANKYLSKWDTKLEGIEVKQTNSNEAPNQNPGYPPYENQNDPLDNDNNPHNNL